MNEPLLIKCAAECGFESVDAMLEAATFDGSCPAICTGCKTIVDQLEPDARNVPCQQCIDDGLGEEIATTVSSVLVLAGIM